MKTVASRSGMIAITSETIAILFLLSLSIVKPGGSTKCGKRILNHPEVNNTEQSGDPYPGQWPWHGVIYDRRSASACGGSLIGEKHLLTSMACVSDDESGSLLNASSLLVVLGVHDRNDTIAEHVQSREVSSIHQPTDANGMVILELSVEVQLGDYVQPVCILEEPNGFSSDSNTIISWTNEGRIVAQKLFASCPGSAESEALKEVCAQDGGSIIYRHVTKEWHMDIVPMSSTVWFAVGLLNCKSPEEFSCKKGETFPRNDTIKLSEFTLWIKNVTKNDDLGSVRWGRDFNPNQQYENLLPQEHCGNIFHPYKYPWLTHFIQESKWKNFTFTRGIGTLINKRYVLTNAGIVMDSVVKSVLLGIHYTNCFTQNATECNPPHKMYKVDYVTVHRDDLALIRLNEDVEYSVHIQPICLPTSTELKQFNPPQYDLVKWIMPPELDQEEVKIAVGYDECINGFLMGKFERGQQICTKGSEIRHFPLNISCSALGQPLVYKVDYDGIKKTVQFGLSLFVCDKGYSKYINVAYYIDWILANVLE